MSVKVLVTGGAGFIGSHVVDRLVANHYKVRVIDDLSTGQLDNIQEHVASGAVDFVKGDIRDVSLVEKSLEGANAVIHLAALASVPFSIEHPALTFDVNLSGTLNLLRYSIKQKVNRFVFISSCAVYGDPKSLPVSEHAQTNPISPYAESKLIAERYCLGFAQRQLIRSVVLRFFNVYGPRQGINEYSGVITRFINCSKKKEPLIIYGDGSQTRDFVNVNDVTQAVLSSITREDAAGEVFNVGSGNPTSIKELANTVLDLACVDSGVRFEETRAGDIKDTFADISKARKLLGYKPKVSLRDGLKALFKQTSLLPNSMRD